MADALHTPGVVSAQDGRLDDGGLLALTGAGLDVRTGVLRGPGTTTLITGTADTAPMAVLVAAHHAVTMRQASEGVYRGTTEIATRVTIDAAPASGSRIDVVWEKQNDASAGVLNPDATTEWLVSKTTGTAAASPTKPAIPVGALELGTVTVGAGATATNGAGVTIANTIRQTVARGARIPVRTAAERDALTAFPGLEVYRLDSGAVEMRNAANNGWVTVYDPKAAPGCELTGTGLQSVGSGSWSSVVWPTEVTDPRDMHSAATNAHRVTVPEARWYTITASVNWDGNNTGRRGIRVNRNSDATTGTTPYEELIPATTSTRTAMSAAMFLSPGDFVCVQVYQDSGANRDVSVNLSHMSVVPGATA